MKKIYIFLFLLLIGAILIFNLNEPKKIETNYKIAKVEKRDFELKLIERGGLEALRFVQIKSPILSNMAKIIEMLPEGSVVKNGDIVARFDTKAFLDEVSKWEHKIDITNSNLIKATKEIEIHKTQSIDGIEKLKKSIEIAKINLDNIKNGKGVVKFNELKQRVLQEKRKVELAKDELKDYDSLYKKGYISKRERDVIEDKLKMSEENLFIAKDRFENYKKYEWSKEIKEYSIRLKELDESLQSKIIEDSFKLENKKVELTKERSLLAYYQNELKKARIDILNCNIKAPIDGVLLYNKIPKNGKVSKVEIGDSIWQNQSFMQIPDTSKMIVKTKIREVDLRFIKVGLRANIILDSYPNRVFSGKIDYIDTIAKKDRDSVNIKYFDTIIKVDNEDKLLRSGMSTRIEIIYDEIKNAISIPASAIHYENSKVYVLTNPQNPTKKYIEIDKVADEFISIKKGLSENQEVLIRDIF